MMKLLVIIERLLQLKDMTQKFTITWQFVMIKSSNTKNPNQYMIRFWNNNLIITNACLILLIFY